MLTHPTIDQLRALKLDGMADAFTELQAQDRAKDLDHAEWLALLLDSPSSIASCTTPIGSRSTGHRYARSRRPRRMLWYRRTQT